VGTVREVPPVRFFASVMYRDETIEPQLHPMLVEAMGPIADRTRTAPFVHSDYYDREMGKGILRYFLLFEPLRPRERLSEIKLKTNEIEAAFTQDGRRRVNLDPGYLALEQVVLATTKGYTHRIYLGKGIFGDLTLVFTDGTFRGLNWTYPDYGSPNIISLFNGWREAYRRDLKCQKA
jgi:hypothetical protein